MNEVTIYGLSGRCKEKKRNFIIPLHKVEFTTVGNHYSQMCPLKVRVTFVCPICKLYHEVFLCWTTEKGEKENDEKCSISGRDNKIN